MLAATWATPGAARTGRRARPGRRTSPARSSLTQPIDIFSEAGSFFAGFQAGYNYMLANRFVVGAEVDASFPSFPNQAGISIGGMSNLTSPTLGAETLSETVLASGTVRGRSAMRRATGYST